MSAIATVHPAPPGDLDWAPTPLHRLTVDRYEAMVGSGVFSERDRFHLINGCLGTKMARKTPHVVADMLCGAALDRAMPPGWHVRPAKPLRLPTVDSEPGPDRCVVRGTIRDHLARHPGPDDAALVVEVSDSSLAEDRELAAIYGRAGVPLYWIINLVDRRVEVYSRPGPNGHAALEVLAPGHALSVAIDGQEVGTIAAAELLP